MNTYKSDVLVMPINKCTHNVQLHSDSEQAMSGHWAVLTSQLIHDRQSEKSFSRKSYALVLITKHIITR